ncbi:methionyl-tRNA formyltransferase [Buchananella felis]|uniref:methionyl-tRNA formyltransferase n=1 Tax=Buchananella felis TaxID=3231492 RepID=UPI003526F40D
MRLLFAGTPEVAVPALAALLDSEHEVVGVLTRAPARSGRGRTLRPSPVEEAARAANLPVLTPATLRDEDVAAQIRAFGADAIITVAYGLLVPPDLLDAAKHGWLNVHFSLLPAWRGAAPVQRAIMAGDELGGVSVFRIEQGLDTGPVFGTATYAFGSEETVGQALEALSHVGSELLLRVLAGIEAGQVVARPQEAEGVSLAPRLEVADAFVSFTTPAFAIDRLIRGVTPAPGAWTTFRQARLKLGPVSVAAGPEAAGLAPGQVLATKKDVFVGTGSGAVRLGQVAPAGKGWMDAASWARGARPAPEELLGVTE